MISKVDISVAAWCSEQKQRTALLPHYQLGSSMSQRHLFIEQLKTNRVKPLPDICHLLLLRWVRTRESSPSGCFGANEKQTNRWSMLEPVELSLVTLGKTSAPKGKQAKPVTREAATS